MNSQTLREARRYEEIYDKRIASEDRPSFHLSPRVGWMNDPNGFCIYKGRYHMFYQYYPYLSVWGPMHWGHAVSDDLLHWEYLPAAMAPDEFYDKDGVFSGSAVTLPDGRHLLMYTGVMNRGTEDNMHQDFQQQCIAIGDGFNYEKHYENPVIPTSKLPNGASTIDFRDPKIWRREDGTYRCLVASRPADKSGQLLLYRSFDAIHWEYMKVFAANKNRYGKMWECPDFFVLDGKGVILTSPQDMLPEGFEFHNGNGTLCLIGDYDDRTETFFEDKFQSIDYGIDFYAPQTILTEDGRRVMIGWMQNWDTSNGHDRYDPWFGQMSLPRELHVKNNRLYQQPIREIESLWTNKVECHDQLLPGTGMVNSVENGETCVADGIALPQISGRRIDMEMTIRPAVAGDVFDRFCISVAADPTHHTDISFRPKESIAKIDRKFSGSRRAVIHQRRAQLDDFSNGEIHLRLVLDRFSMEVFLDDGAKVMTATLYTDQDADGIFFHCDKDVIIDLVKYDLKD